MLAPLARRSNPTSHAVRSRSVGGELQTKCGRNAGLGRSIWVPAWFDGATPRVALPGQREVTSPLAPPPPYRVASVSQPCPNRVAEVPSGQNADDAYPMSGYWRRILDLGLLVAVVLVVGVFIGLDQAHDDNGRLEEVTVSRTTRAQTFVRCGVGDRYGKASASSLARGCRRG
jgi:hypothetical protein